MQLMKRLFYYVDNILKVLLKHPQLIICPNLVILVLELSDPA
jgi:hypothetical protein